MRCFIAIDMPADAEAEARRIQAMFGMKGLRKTKSFHLTLKFLGETDRQRLEASKEKLRDIKLPRFSLELSKIGVFPDEKRARVLWIGLDGDAARLQKEIDEKLSGISDKDNRFHPHITLARISYPDDKERFLELLSTEVKKIRFDVKSFALYKSTLTRDGPIHEKIEEYHLSPESTS
ncbi:RNA 2',3'-cyclic phosphodiesterase [Candidatus Woesearchaeota archaeon]|nr:RNA 2',3'-cyclic phosphodiesterase [Candidatus Woesearchaeota archaeon]